MSHIGGSLPPSNGKKEESLRADVVLYHGDCPDGYSAAFVLYTAGYIGSKTKIIPDNPYAIKAPTGVSGLVFIIDLAYRLSVVKEILDEAHRVVFIDHHRTHRQDLEELSNDSKYEGRFRYVYDEEECAATLTWKYCFPEERIPTFLRMIRDNDIGIWMMEDTHPFITALETDFTLEPDIEHLKKFVPLLSMEGLKDLLARGRLYYRYRELIIRRAMKYGSKLNWGKYNVVFINIAGTIASEVAVKIMQDDKNVDFVVAYHYNIKRHMFIYQMRSVKVDVEKIARKNGGGGHMLAASFSKSAFPEKLVEQEIPEENKQTGGTKKKHSKFSSSSAVASSATTSQEKLSNTPEIQENGGGYEETELISSMQQILHDCHKNKQQSGGNNTRIKLYNGNFASPFNPHELLQGKGKMR
jgi:oligoribonuclease NrnB/cAMP/cGMP phosphodiesterase (DHH superfamily)